MERPRALCRVNDRRTWCMELELVVAEAVGATVIMGAVESGRGW